MDIFWLIMAFVTGLGCSYISAKLFYRDGYRDGESDEHLRNIHKNHRGES